MEEQNRDSNLNEPQDPSYQSTGSKGKDKKLSEDLMNNTAQSKENCHQYSPSSPPEGLPPDDAGVMTFTTTESTLKSENSNGELKLKVMDHIRIAFNP